MTTPLSYVTSGPSLAPTIVMCHGLTGSAFSLTDAVKRLVHAGYRVITPDFRGHGLSPRWREGDDGQVLVDDMVELLRTMRIYDEALAASRGVSCPPPPVIIGHSMGGATAGVVGYQYPELVSAVVCEDPALFGTRSQEQLLSRGRARVRVVRDERRDLVSSARLALESQFMPTDEALVSVWASQMVDEQMLADGVVSPPVHWETWMRGLIEGGCCALVLTGDVHGSARVGIHGLEVMATMGWSVTQADQRRTVTDWDTHARCQAVMIAGAGHQVRRMCPDDFWAVTVSWLERYYPSSLGAGGQ